MGRDQRCIQQAMAFDANIRAVQEAICAIPCSTQARRIGVNKRSKRVMQD